jgi:hypothetical protein
LRSIKDIWDEVKIIKNVLIDQQWMVEELKREFSNATKEEKIAEEAFFSHMDDTNALEQRKEHVDKLTTDSEDIYNSVSPVTQA